MALGVPGGAGLQVMDSPLLSQQIHAQRLCIKQLKNDNNRLKVSRLPLQAAATGYRYRLPLKATATGYCYRLPLQATATGCHYRLPLQATATGYR